MLETAVAPIPQVAQDTNEVWIEALPARVYRTPQYGEVPITHDKLQRFITNFRQNVRGQEIATDYEHGIDSAKGLQASGWYRDFDIRPSSDDPTQMSLYAKVEFTDEAKQDILNKKFKYWSLEWDDEYETDNGATVPDVVIGGGLTNRPVAKRTMPINFSEQMWNELDDDTKKEFPLVQAADLLLKKGYQIRLGESAAWEHSDPGIVAPLYGSAQNQPDPGFGRVVPRVTGDVAADDVAVSGLWRRDPLPAGDPDTADDITKPELRQPSGRDLSEFTAFAEGDEVGYLKAALKPLEAFLASETTEKDQDDVEACRMLVAKIKSLLADEQGELELQVPKMASEVRALVISLVNAKGGKKVEFTEQHISKLKELGLELDDEDKFVESADKAFSELKQFKDSVDASSQEKDFSEKYPAVWAEHQRLLKTNRDNDAKAFAESVSRISKVTGTSKDTEGNETPTLEPTRNGLSGLALATLAEAHKKFSEGTATLEDFESAVTSITNGGIVEFGEVGSSRDKDEPVVADGSTATGIAAARKLFAEKVVEIQASDEKYAGPDNYMKAIAKASEQYPELAAAYRSTAA